LYDFTKFYLYLPTGMTITPSEMCPFKQASMIDKNTAIGDLYGTSNQLNSATINLMNSYNIYELDSSLMNTKTDDNSGQLLSLFGFNIPLSNGKHNDTQMINAIKTSQNNPNTGSIMQFYCQTNINAAKIIGNTAITQDKTYIYAEYNYLRYIPFSLTYNIPTEKTSTSN